MRSCGNCEYYFDMTECRRFPAFVRRFPRDVCGEHKLITPETYEAAAPKKRGRPATKKDTE